MSLNEAQLRNEVIRVYDKDPRRPNEVWRAKVKRMSYAQVFAIYIRFRREEKIK